ncbi:ROK family protein [Rhodococcus sp. BP-252]|uniref:polyphosphate--glucose phosphotransferase n=1 Tax=unclassified Rhodococcus (in: high G+C Gram-positive bacteria) TaxID=192944 RepID=UPI000DF1E64F|nr:MULTISPECIES: ROK family protein [unclassified Rhodococcus (in: high G+C Gram-positive bacteria)]MBY6410951.1 ROK family protein [Rhodococcus sp. BP-320]MBY6415610.1 ROK family protein [Rhodococcus sp. BP-321]MBY6421008.1 ROK family protein [Rhodococcus sp. BP-324]MBY6426063.1 ROK family protein [Rhodococcus sp. BP-323]MBY6430816.1 ROK family protein [Rhodococcus sp. BP-322]
MTQAGSGPQSTDGTQRLGFGVDVGGSGIKGGIVDLVTGELVGDRYKIETPQPSTPEAVAGVVAEIVKYFDWSGPVGVTLPAVVTAGIARSAANIDKGWIDTDAKALFARAIGHPNITVLNDADAAGVAEDKYGGGKDKSGVVILLTFGTGIGSAVLHDGVLLPNTELGHLEVNGKEAEHRAASSVKERKDLSYKEWAKEVSKVLETFEALLWPDLFIAGGGISRKSEKWIPHLTNRTPVVAATLLNTAGIVGAALAADTAALQGHAR